jgi:hypothetical protein
MRNVTVGLLIAMSTARPCAAQFIHGVVRDSQSGAVIAGAVVTVADSAGHALQRGLANGRGEFRLKLDRSTRRISAIKIGFTPFEAAVARGASSTNGDATVDISLSRLAVFLEPVTTIASGKCSSTPDRALAFALLQQARAGLLAAVVARDADTSTQLRLGFRRAIADDGKRILHQIVRADSLNSNPASFAASKPASSFIQTGFVSETNGVQTFFAPDAETLLDDQFSQAYCFRIAEPRPERVKEVGLRFDAADGKRGRVDIAGTMWVDTSLRVVRDVEFRYVGLDRRTDYVRPGGRIGFREMPNGAVLVDQWGLRLPHIEADTNFATPRPTIRVWYTAHEVGGELARVKWSVGENWSASLGTFRARAVHSDGSPAPGAKVRLFDTDYETVADTSGTLEITNLVPGPYTAMGIDPRLAVFGVLVSHPTPFVVGRGETATGTVVVPRSSESAAARCAARTSRVHDGSLASVDVSKDNRLLVTVIDADDGPVAGATWTVSEYVGDDHLEVIATGDANSSGTFTVCSPKVASGRHLAIQARSGNGVLSLVRFVAQDNTTLTVQLSSKR